MDDDAILEELLAAKKRAGLTLFDVCELLRRSKGTFRPDPPALSRKLRRETTISLLECEQLAAVLGYQLKWSMRRRRCAA
jgi:hypothetical protein